MPKRNKAWPYKNLHINIHTNSTPNAKGTNNSSPSNDKSVVHSYDEIFSHKNELSIDTLHNTDEPCATQETTK